MAVDSVVSKTTAPITPVSSQPTTQAAAVSGNFAATLDEIQESTSLPQTKTQNDSTGTKSSAESDDAEALSPSSAQTNAVAASTSVGSAASTRSITPTAAVASTAATAKVGGGAKAASGYDSIGYDSIAAGGDGWAGAEESDVIGGSATATHAAAAAQSYGTPVGPGIDAKSFAFDRGVDLSATLDLLRGWMTTDAVGGSSAKKHASDEDDAPAHQSSGQSAANPDLLAALDLGQGRFALAPQGQDSVAAETPVLDFYTNTVQTADRTLSRPKPIIPSGLSAVEQKNIVSAFDVADHYGLLRNRADFLANLDSTGKPTRDPDELAQWIKSGKIGDPPLPLNDKPKVAAV